MKKSHVEGSLLVLKYHHHITDHPDNGHLLVIKGDLLLWRSCSPAWGALWGERGTGWQVCPALSSSSSPASSCWSSSLSSSSSSSIWASCSPPSSLHHPHLDISHPHSPPSSPPPSINEKGNTKRSASSSAGHLGLRTFSFVSSHSLPISSHRDVLHLVWIKDPMSLSFHPCIDTWNCQSSSWQSVHKTILQHNSVQCILVKKKGAFHCNNCNK